MVGGTDSSPTDSVMRSGRGDQASEEDDGDGRQLDDEE